MTDSSGAMPFAAVRGINSPGAATGILRVDSTPNDTTDREATVKFRVKVNAGTGSVSNQATARYTDNSTGSAVTTSVLTDDPATSVPNDATKTTITGVADLTITKTAASSVVMPSTPADNSVTPAVTQELKFITYTLMVTNGGTGPTTGTVTVTDTLPSGLSATDISGTGWSCTLNTLTCTRNDVLVAGSSYPALTVTVQAPFKTALETNASLRDFTNTATVGGGGQTNTSNDTATANTKVAYVKLSKKVRNLTVGTAFASTNTGTPGQRLEYCIDFVNYGGVALSNFKVTDDVPGNTISVTTGYDDLETSTVTGFGLQLTRNGAVSYLTSTTDTDGGSLTTVGGGRGAGVMQMTLPSGLALGENSSVCFRAAIR